MLDAPVAELAATQYGVFARFQLLALAPYVSLARLDHAYEHA